MFGKNGTRVKIVFFIGENVPFGLLYINRLLFGVCCEGLTQRRTQEKFADDLC